MNEQKNNQELILVNVVESLVRGKARELIKTMDMCKCDKCFMDVCAITLNRLKPKYVTTTRGELLSQISTFSSNYQSELMVEVLKALVAVKNSPKH